MMSEDIQSITVSDEVVYLPPPTFNAFYLIRHSMQHFAAISISVRHVLDWAFFVEKYGSKIDWEWLSEALSRFKMLDFFNCINSICIECLGFDKELFPCKIESLSDNVDRGLRDRVLRDIIFPEFSEELPAGTSLFKRILYKYRRWQANAWKQKLCYSDNRFLAFWQSVWDHVLRPGSI